MNKQSKIKLYARALAETLTKKDVSVDEKKVVNNFMKLLVAAGLERKSKEIMDLVEDIILAKHGNKRITFETARKVTAEQKKMLDGIVKMGDVVKEKINPELIAGIKIIINGSQQFDASMQSKLQNILK